jgi:hypothetical protein
MIASVTRLSRGPAKRQTTTESIRSFTLMAPLSGVGSCLMVGAMCSEDEDSQVRGYPLKRSHLVALRPTRISANDPRRHGGRGSDKPNWDQQMTKLIITGLHHDTNRKRSVVYVRWEDDPEKNLGLPVRFGCSMDNVRDEAAKAVKALSKDLASAIVASP